MFYSSLSSLQTVYLRRFKSLNTLNLSGNPFCEDENYKQYVVAHLPSMVYLDYRLIDDATRETAEEKYRYSIEELVHDEEVARRKVEEQEKRDKERHLHKVL